MSLRSAALLWLAALCGTGQASAQDLAPKARAEARLELLAKVAGSEVELGEPLELMLVVHHAADDKPAIDAAALEADPAWALTSPVERITLPDPEREGLALTRVRWTVAALAAGELDLPAPAVTLPLPGGASEPVAVARGKLAVRGVLAQGEDAPRPITGFLGLAPAAPGPSWWISAAVVALLGALSAWIWIRARARRRRAAAPLEELTPQRRLAVLEESELSTPEAVREAHYELTRALRAYVDGVTQPIREGLTDEEWLLQVTQRVEPERARRLRALFAACSSVKYGAEQPTHWAARERIVAARELATALATQPGAGEAAA